MIKVSVIFLLSYFLLGTILLPVGDFSMLPNLPNMYAHCKAEEDPDMDLPDFVVEHLLCVDALFGPEQPEPDEKPHQPIQFTHHIIQFNATVAQVTVKAKEPIVIKSLPTTFAEPGYQSDFVGSIFRPPVA